MFAITQSFGEKQISFCSYKWYLNCHRPALCLIASSERYKVGDLQQSSTSSRDWTKRQWIAKTGCASGGLKPTEDEDVSLGEDNIPLSFEHLRFAHREEEGTVGEITRPCTFDS